MKTSNFSTLTEHVAEQIRQGMLEGRWRNTLPGRTRLAEELGFSHWTVEEAIQRLTKEGLLVSQGAGLRRKIVLDVGVSQARAMRVAVLLYEPSDRKTGYLVELIHRLQAAGHEAFFCNRTAHDMGMDLKRICRFVEGLEADAWVVVAGSRDLLEWFAAWKAPVFSLFGRFRQVNIAGTSPNKAAAYVEIVDRLVAMGHRRIVNIVREERRKPTPGYLDKLFLERLEYHDIQTGVFNLPDWEDSAKGLHSLLNSLFQTTPPTALLLDEPLLFIAAREHLARKGILAPENISLVCCDALPSLDWCIPQVTCIQWDSRPVIKRVVKWVDNIGRGKDDRRKSSTKAHLALGGTLGLPADRVASDFKSI